MQNKWTFFSSTILIDFDNNETLFFFSFVINENIELTQAHSIQAIHIKSDKARSKKNIQNLNRNIPFCNGN